MLKQCLMKVQKEIMNLIYVGFSNGIFFIPQELKFFLVIFLTIFVRSQIVAQTQIEAGDGPNKPSTINL